MNKTLNHTQLIPIHLQAHHPIESGKTFLDRNPTLNRVSFTLDQEEQLLEVFPRYNVRNVHKYGPQNASICLPYLDCNHVYVTDLAQEFFAFSQTDFFQFFASSLVINIHHLTRDGKGWTTGPAREKAKKKIRKLLGGIPASVFVKVISEQGTGTPIVFTLICVPDMEAPPDL